MVNQMFSDVFFLTKFQKPKSSGRNIFQVHPNTYTMYRNIDNDGVDDCDHYNSLNVINYFRKTL